MPLWADGGHYDAWATFLQRWGAGEQVDATTLPTLTIEDLTPDTWERLSNRMLDAFERRLRLWSTALTDATGEARDEFGVARALTQSRGALRSIRALAQHPGLPADLSRQFVDVVDTSVRSAQDALDQQVSSMQRAGVPRSVAEARLRTVRDNPLTTVTTETAAPPPDPWAAAGPSRRRVIPQTAREKP